MGREWDGGRGGGGGGWKSLFFLGEQNGSSFVIGNLRKKSLKKN